jgi:Zn-dependent protease
LSVLATLDLDTIVRGAFSVRDSFVLPDGEAEYKVVYDEKAKGAFERLYDTLRPKGYVPRLTGSRAECVLLVRKAPTEKGSSRVPVVLGLLTLAAIVAYGWLQYIVYQQLLPERLPVLMGVAYVLVLILVIGLHEVVHRRSASRGGTRTPVPYFLPGLPAFTALPSFGTVLVHRELPVNRDALFRTAFLGPIVAIALCILFYAIGVLTAATVSMAQVQSGLAALPNIQLTTPNPSIIESLIVSFLKLIGGGPPTTSGSQLISPIGAAADTGLILTFFNLLPATQLDGGQLCESILGYRGLRITTYLSIVALLVLDTPNYWIMAVIVLVIAGRPARLDTLDEVSEPSRGKKILFAVALLLALASVPIPQNIATLRLIAG